MYDDMLFCSCHLSKIVSVCIEHIGTNIQQARLNRTHPWERLLVLFYQRHPFICSLNAMNAMNIQMNKSQASTSWSCWVKWAWWVCMYSVYDECNIRLLIVRWQYLRVTAWNWSLMGNACDVPWPDWGVGFGFGLVFISLCRGWTWSLNKRIWVLLFNRYWGWIWNIGAWLHIQGLMDPREGLRVETPTKFCAF